MGVTQIKAEGTDVSLLVTLACHSSTRSLTVAFPPTFIQLNGFAFQARVLADQYSRPV